MRHWAPILVFAVAACSNAEAPASRKAGQAKASATKRVVGNNDDDDFTEPNSGKSSGTASKVADGDLILGDDGDLTTGTGTGDNAAASDAGSATGEAPAPQPSGQVTAPSQLFAATNAAQIYRIEATFTDTTAASTWSAYYELGAGDTNTDHPIVQDRAVTSASFDWDTSAAPAAAYYIYMVVKTGAKTAGAHSAGTVLVTHPAAGHNPTAALSASANGTDTTRAFIFPVDISFTAADADLDPMLAKIEYSQGTSWLPVVDSLPVLNGLPTTYHWDPPANLKPDDGAAYKFRVTVDDGHGGVAVVQSAEALGLASMVYTFNEIRPLFAANNGCSPCHDAGGPRSALFRDDVFTPLGLGDGAYGTKALNRVLRSPNNPMPPAGPTAELTTKLQLWEWQGMRLH